jgi:hypothetical protein
LAAASGPDRAAALPLMLRRRGGYKSWYPPHPSIAGLWHDPAAGHVADAEGPR